MELNNYTVYKHICPSGKIYIGITKKNAKSRWANGFGYRGNKHFYNAINKYGWDNIEHEILFTNLTKEEAKETEIRLIAEHNANNENFGYNRTIGGDTNVPLYGERNGMYGKNHSDETRKKISENQIKLGRKGINSPLYGIPRSEETKRKMSEACIGKSAGEKNYFYGKSFNGEDHPCYGVPQSDEHKRKISEFRKGKFMGKDAYNAIPILCVQTNEVFECAMDIKRKLGYDNSVINKCCKGTVKSAYGYNWTYANPPAS